MGRARQLAGRGDNDSILMDASAASTDENEKLLLDGTDSSYTNAGFDFLQEDFGTDVSYDNLDPNSRELANDSIFFMLLCKIIKPYLIIQQQRWIILPFGRIIMVMQIWLMTHQDLLVLCLAYITFNTIHI